MAAYGPSFLAEEKMADNVNVIMARLEERVNNLIEKISTSEDKYQKDLEDLAVTMTKLDDRLKKIEDMAIRYKGGFLAVLSLGGIIGWVSANCEFVERIGNWLRGH